MAHRSRTAPHLARRARIILACADSHDNKAVAKRLPMSQTTVCKWRGRFVRERLDGLYDEPRPGAPRQISDEQIEQVIVGRAKRRHAAGRTGAVGGWSSRTNNCGAASIAAQLKSSIREFIAAHQADPKPFIWTKSADHILASIARFAQRTLDPQTAPLIARTTRSGHQMRLHLHLHLHLHLCPLTSAFDLCPLT